MGMKVKRIDGATPAGGDYSEIYYLDDEGNTVDESLAVKGIIRECKKDGSLIQETFIII